MSSTDADGGGAQQEVSLSVEETNKLRLALGLKPLEVGPAAASSKEKQAEDNYRRYREEEAKKEQRKSLVEKIHREKELALRDKKHEGHGLGEALDAEEGGDDALAWVRKSRQKQTDTGASAPTAGAKVRSKEQDRDRRLARRRAKELDEMDRQQPSGSAYSASDLAGLRVGHDLGDFADSSETILVLKDAMIIGDEEGGDELVSLNMAEHERAKKNIENKKKKPGYRAMDDEDALALGKQRGILQQYDDEEEQSGFMLGVQSAVKPSAAAAAAEDKSSKTDVASRLREGTVSLAYDKTREAADYYTKEELTAFKKPKKTKSRRANTRRQQLSALDGDDDDEGRSGRLGRDDMAVDQLEPGSFKHSNVSADVSNTNFVDDDDLQLALARTRKQAMMMNASAAAAASTTGSEPTTQEGGADNGLNRSTRPSLLPSAEDILQKMQERADLFDTKPGDSGLVISETSEFVRTLDSVPVIRAKSSASAGQSGVETSSNVQHKASWRQAMKEAGGDGEEDGDDDSKMPVDSWIESNAGTKKDVEMADEDGVNMANAAATIEEEPLVSNGLAATVALLSKKGIVKHLSEEEKRAEESLMKRQKWMAEQKILEAKRVAQMERERERRRAEQLAPASGATSAAAAASRAKAHAAYDEQEERERERAERAAERARLRELEDRFKNYVPNVDIKYHDEYGRELTTREAWRLQTHRFHGMTSGRAKTEKLFQRMQEKIKTEQMGTTETPQGVAQALTEQTRQTGRAFVTLGVGNKSAAPLAAVLGATTGAISGSGATKATSGMSQKAKTPKAAAGIGTTTTTSLSAANGGGGTGSSAGRERIAFGFSAGGPKRKTDAGAAIGSAKRARAE